MISKNTNIFKESADKPNRTAYSNTDMIVENKIDELNSLACPKATNSGVPV